MSVRKRRLHLPMTEQEWLTCDRVWDMIGFLRGRMNPRKQCLFAVACCRRVWQFMPDEQSRRAVEVTESHADGAATRRELTEAKARAEAVAKTMTTHWTPERSAAWAAVWAASRGGGWLRAIETAFSVMSRVAADATWQRVEPENGVDAAYSAAQRAVVDTNLAEQRQMAGLLRHIVGNPFRVPTTPGTWPATVVDLAESCYNGQDCAFALHDALLETGHADLAQHFRETTEHPKGCWVLDLLLGKE